VRDREDVEMSLVNRARALMQKTGLTYEEAIAHVRATGERAARLARETGWTLEISDRYLFDAHAPVEVIGPAGTRRMSRDELIDAVCETLRVTTVARSVVVRRKDGRIVARVGSADAVDLLPRAWDGNDRPEVHEAGGGAFAYVAGFLQGICIVGFHVNETSLGLVRLRTRRAVEEIERLLREGDRSPGVPPAGRGGPEGLPAEVRVVAPDVDSGAPHPGATAYTAAVHATYRMNARAADDSGPLVGMGSPTGRALATGRTRTSSISRPCATRHGDLRARS
jgi:hypothetical protein